MTHTSPRPKNVVMVDAADPLVEIHGEFFWREDHEKMLEAAREQAFRDGFAHGYASRQTAVRRMTVRGRRRRGCLGRLVLVLLCLSLMLSVVLSAVQALPWLWH